jgi:hypothetical protein
MFDLTGKTALDRRQIIQNGIEPGGITISYDGSVTSVTVVSILINAFVFLFTRRNKYG